MGERVLLEVQTDATPPSPEAVLETAGDDVETRVETITRVLTRMVLEDGALFRSQMRVTQDLWFARQGDPSGPVREGRRLASIDRALEPVANRVPPGVLQRLREALAVVVGVEPVISSRDVCGLSPDATEEVLVWTATSIVRAALSGDRQQL